MTVRIGFSKSSDWGSGFVGALTLGDTAAALDGWQVGFDADFTIGQIWNATILSHVGNHYVIGNAAWDGVVAAGGTAGFGFLATPGGAAAAPANLTLDGVAPGGSPVAPPAPLPTLSVADLLVAEPGFGSTTAAFTVTLAGAAAAPVTVHYATADGTALAGAGYVATSGDLTFAPGVTSLAVPVTLLADGVQPDTTFNLALSDPAGAGLGDAGAIATIHGAVAPTVGIAGTTVTQGGPGTTTTAAFTVTLSGAWAAPVTVHYATGDGSAEAGSDYVATAGSLTFAPGETSHVVSVTVPGEAAGGAPESFHVTLDAPVGATLGVATGTGLVLGAAPATLPVVGIGDLTVAEPAAAAHATSGAPGFLHTAGNEILDASGAEFKISGVNWFGMEGNARTPDGLYARNYESMMDQMVGLGFNTIRLPFSLDSLAASSHPTNINYALNPDLAGLTSLGVLDKVVDYAGHVGLRIILDEHRETVGNGTTENGLWHDATHSQADWVADWTALATRYAGNATVIGADLHNEPGAAATWGDGGPNDWAAAATLAGNAVTAANPGWLTFIEGVTQYHGDWYWQGGNLEGVADHPIVLNTPGHVVYSPHDYPDSVYAQPFFNAPDFPNNLPAEFKQHWGYIYDNGTAPVYLGEFGSRLTDPKDVAWLDKIVPYIANPDGTAHGAAGVSWTWWSWNPNSGDTGGILGDDWQSVQTAKVAALQPIEFTGGAGAAGGFVAKLAVTLSAAATAPVTVGYHTVAGSAAAGEDFTATSGSVTFQPGERAKTVNVSILADGGSGTDESFGVVLDAPTGATLGKAVGTVTITQPGAVAPPAPPAPPATGLTAAFAAQSVWETGFTGVVTVHNGGTSAVHGWQVELDMPFHLTNSWNGTVAGTTAAGTLFHDAGWNADIAAGADASFGFQADGKLATGHVGVTFA